MVHFLCNLNLAMCHFLLRMAKLRLIIHLYLDSLSWCQPWPPTSDQKNHLSDIDDSHSTSITLVHSFCLSYRTWGSFVIQQYLSASIICWVKINTCPTIFHALASFKKDAPRTLSCKSINIPV